MKQYDITIESGADFYFPHRLKDDSGNLINLTGATVSAQLREYPEALDAFDFTCSHNGLGGQVILTMPHEATAQIGYTAGFYDVFVEYADETVEKVLWGTVTIQPNVTKPIAGTPMVLLSFASEDDFPRKGIITRMYFSHASSKLYRWNGTAYIGIQQDVTWETLEGKPDTFPPDAHQHDDRYYTEQEADSLLSDKADADSVYTKTEVDTALSSKASIIRTTASGSLVHITDAAAMPVENLIVDIEPIQDLHGQSSPYPAGGGKNIVNIADGTGTAMRGCTPTYDNNGGLVFSGTPTEGGYFGRWNISLTLEAGTYTFSIKEALGRSFLFLTSSWSAVATITASNRAVTVTLTEAKTISYVCSNVSNDEVGQTVTANAKQIQIEKGSSATPFTPYSNVCPISGHATATVTRTGVNVMYDLLNYPSGFVTDSGGQYVQIQGSLGGGYTALFRCKAGQTYTISGMQGKRNRFIVGFYGDTVPEYNVKTYDWTSSTISSTTSVATFTAKTTGYATCYFYLTSADPDPSTPFDTSKIQIELGSTATAYEPYHGQTVTINLNGTRYGGTVDVKTGVLTVKALLLETTWGGGGSTQVGTNCTKRTISYYGVDAAVFKYKAESSVDISNILPFEHSTADKPHFYVSDSYDSAHHRQYIAVWMLNGTPDSTALQFWLALRPEYYQTVQLTPAELSLLYGTNNLWASTGDVSVGYRADTKLYIDRKIAELQALILDN